MDYDVIVIGSGIAGTLAAINAAKTKKVAVVRKGYGATALSSGAFDIASRNGKRGRPFKGFVNVTAAIGNVLENEQYHPYSILSMAFTGDRFNEFTSMVKTIGDQLFDELKSMGLRYEGSWENNMIIPNQHGTFKVTSFCQSSMTSGNLARLMGRAVLFIGFEKTAIHNKTRAEFLSSILSKYGFASFKNIGYTNVPLHSHGIKCNEHDFISLAAMMDNSEQAGKILSIIKQTLDTMEYEHAFLPPIMGISKYSEVSKMFTDYFGDRVSEFLSPPSSAPGLRLQYALDKLLARHGVAIIDGAASTNDAPDTVRTINVTQKDGRLLSLSANSFVLATGKFISSGIISGKTWKEAVFGLPVFIGAHPIKDSFPMNYLTDDPFDEQILFSMGVKVDNTLRPVNADTRVIYKNLYAAGAVLSGYNYIYDKTGMGTAMITGAKAGIFSAG
jgi:glycerol-3-phosphate dehydrogenase subunit B